MVKHDILLFTTDMLNDKAVLADAVLKRETVQTVERCIRPGVFVCVWLCVCVCGGCVYVCTFMRVVCM